jgi:hypothetical protein
MTTNEHRRISLSNRIEDFELLMNKRLPIFFLMLLMISSVFFIQVDASNDDDNREEETDFSDDSDERMSSEFPKRQDENFQQDSSMSEDEVFAGFQMSDDNGYDTRRSVTEQDFQGTPESVIIEKGNVGIEVFLDYILYLKQQGNSDVLLNPARSYSVGSFSLTEDESILLDFDECHNTDCSQPEQIRAVYLVDSDTDDIDIVNANIDEGQIISLEQSETDEFEYRMPEQIQPISNPNEDSSHKIVIHTEQKDGIDAFYITNGVEVYTVSGSY